MEINKKQNPQGCRLGGYIESVGRGLGTQVWALHPTVRGSIPLRSTNYYIKLFGGLQ